MATGFVLELAALYREAPEDTLSEFIRAFVVHSPYGAMLMGAFLVWLLWHWLYVRSGLNQSDIMMALIGAVVGLGGWYYRNRRSEEEPEDSNPTEGYGSVEGLNSAAHRRAERASTVDKDGSTYYIRGRLT